MGRPKLHDIDAGKLLASITSIYTTSLESVRSELAAAELIEQDRANVAREVYYDAFHAAHTCRRELAVLESDGIPYDLPAFLGYLPTASQRILAQTAIRKLEADGLVTLLGAKARWIKPTAAGIAKVKPTTTEGIADA